MAESTDPDAEVPLPQEQDIQEEKKKDADLPDPDLSAQNRQKRLNDALKSKLFGSVDKDGSYFSYLFLEKIFGETRKCCFCGATGSGKLPKNDDSLELYVTETGLVGRQNIECLCCGKIETITSCEKAQDVPKDQRLAIQGLEVRDYCKKITHFEVLHDLMEMLHIASTEDDKLRREKHAEVADFMMRNARKVCEEWCKAEYAELRLKKYLRLREETLLTMYNPTFTPDSTEEYMEMYRMMADSFRQNRDKVVLLLELLKESLIDYPTRSSFMMWVSIAMMHSENYPQFKAAYDPRSFMRVDSSEYQALQDRYLALNVPLGIKKIPVVFILFEIPRFYHYVDFLSRRLGKKKLKNFPFLTTEDRALLVTIAEENERLGIRRRPKTGMLVSPEAHLDFLTRKEEMEREMIYRSCREKEKEKGGVGKPLSKKQLAISAAVTRKEDIIATESAPSHRPVVLSTDDFRSMLVEHLKANEANVASKPAASNHPVLPKYATYGSNFPPVEPSTTLPEPSPILKPSKGGKGSKSRKRKGGKKDKDKKKTVLVAQVDTEMLRQQGFKVAANSSKTTVICSKDGTVEHILEGFDTPEQVKAFLSQKYNVLSQQQGTGYISLPTCDQPGGLALHPSAMEESDERLAKIKQGKKKGKGRKAEKNHQDDELSGFPFTSQWTDEKREYFKHELIKGLEKATTTPLAGGTLIPVSEETLAIPLTKENVDKLPEFLSQAMHGTGKDLPYSLGTTQFVDPATIDALQRKKNPNEAMKAIIKNKFRKTGDEEVSDHKLGGERAVEFMVKDLLPKAEIITVGTSEEEMKKPFVEDLYETPEERARLEAERDEILKQLSNDDVDFDLSKARKIGTIGDQTVYVEDCGIDFDALLQARALETLAKLESGESGGRVSYVESLESGERLESGGRLESGERLESGGRLGSGGRLASVESLESEESLEAKPTGKKTARDKFKSCENCDMEIVDRILVCAGCKKVAYCNYRCQKAHWKKHKKTCSYALKKEAKDRTG